MGRQRSLLAFILILAIAAIVVLVTIPIPLGLDLRGGSQLTLQLLPTEAVPNITPDKLEAVESVIQNRVNGLGVSEAQVQTAGQDQLIVQLPGVSDSAQAERVLGGTAQLDFREQIRGTEAQLPVEFNLRSQTEADIQRARENGDLAGVERGQAALAERNAAIASLFQKTELTGDMLRDAREAYDSSTGAWQVDLAFNNEGGEQFAAITRNVAGTGRSLGIFLDDRLISAPTVQVRYAETGITGGRATISGGFTSQDAADLAIQLRGGALPVPVEIVENRTVGATLGQDSIRRSIYAGVAGLILVLIFMVVYYRLPGLIADISLIIYALLTLAVFDLVGVVLTLPGIAGFILSIGMAVDANVLIFERTREELRSGKTLYRSVEAGFYRAFSSILDSNVTTLIACLALIWLGVGLVKGFAVTLAIGVVVSMFTALSCSRTLLLFVLGFPQFRKPELFSPKSSSTSLQAEKSS
jgi:preprotein translocase subunit SecD